MDKKKFIMIDEEFICNNCNRKVLPLGYTARDHCPYCLHSVHVDVNPGDRSANCHGDLVPISIEKAKNDILKIKYKCNKCGEIKRNKSATDDDFDEILKIMSNFKY